MADKVEQLVAQLKTEDSARLAATLAKLTKLGKAATPAAPAVIALLTGDYSVGQAARAALLAMTPADVAKELVAALQDGRQAAMIEYFDELAGELYANGYVEPPLVAALKKVAVPVMLALIAKPEVNRKGLAHPLGMLGAGKPAVFDALVELLDDEDAEVRFAAPAGLSYFGDPAVKHLEALLAKDGGRSRTGVACVKSVCFQLTRVGTKRALKALQAASKKPEYGRQPRDMNHMLWQRLHKAETQKTMAKLETKRLAKLAAAKQRPAKTPAKKPATKKRK